MTDTAHHPLPNDTASTLATADDDQGPQPDPIVVSVGDLLAPEVGPLRDLATAMTDEWTFSWAGTDQAGQSRSGKLVRDFRVGQDQKSIELGWQIVLDGTAP